MKKFTVLVMGLVSLGAMAGCEDDDRKSVRVPAAVQGAFGKMFPAASHVEWEDRGGYVVADFRSAGTVMQAWFDAAGKWHMTEEDISYAELPQAVLQPTRPAIMPPGMWTTWTSCSATARRRST